MKSFYEEYENLEELEVRFMGEMIGGLERTDISVTDVQISFIDNDTKMQVTVKAESKKDPERPGVMGHINCMKRDFYWQVRCDRFMVPIFEWSDEVVSRWLNGRC